MPVTIQVRNENGDSKSLTVYGFSNLEAYARIRFLFESLANVHTVSFQINKPPQKIRIKQEKGEPKCET